MTEPSSPGALARLKTTLRALSHRNFRLFFLGQGISLVGTWMQIIAMSWLVYRLTRSAFLLGLVGFAGQIPTFLFSSLAGVLADRWNRQRMVIITQTLLLIQASVLAILVLGHWITIWQIIALSIFAGLVNAFDIPIRQSFMVDMVDRKEDLGNAIALNSSLVNAARLVGPSLAGILIALVGEGWCFAINAASFVAVLAALVTMKIERRTDVDLEAKWFPKLKEGFRYAFGFQPIASILLLISVVSLTGTPYSVLMPIFATKILIGGPNLYGALMGMAGCGALLGAGYLASRKNALGLGRLIPSASIIFGTALIAFSLSHTFWLSLLAMVVVGWGLMVQMAGSNILLQTIVEDDKRGRVMSFYTMAFMGMAPMGSLLAGTIAARIGAPRTVMLGGICCIVSGLVFASRLSTLRAHVRPIYQRMGILPEVALGIQSATQIEPGPE